MVGGISGGVVVGAVAWGGGVSPHECVEDPLPVLLLLPLEIELSARMLTEPARKVGAGGRVEGASLRMDLRRDRIPFVSRDAELALRLSHTLRHT